jgi:2-keto-4-pentenoate hydratase/2-oxohepta-3-ene-1,7-dioic acid hydratase in catechol pathway
MKLAVFDDYRIGVVEGDSLYDVTAAVPEALSALRVHVNWLIGNWQSALPKVLACREQARPVPLNSVKLLPPSPSPSHIFAVPANYGKNGTGEKGFFLKAPGSLAGQAEGIRLPHGSTRRFDHEPELAVIIGRRARNVPRSEALQYVFGYSCLVDATIRVEPGAREEEHSLRKSFETSTPLGPYLVTADEVRDPHALDNRLWVNGKLRQEANTRDMIVGIAELIELISAMVPLNPGDVVATGTPEGVGPVNPGDRVRIAIDQVGDMTLAVRQNDARPPNPY